MSRKKPTGGRVTPKGTAGAAPAKRRDGAVPGPGHGGPDRFAATARRFSAPPAPQRSGHHRGNR